MTENIRVDEHSHQKNLMTWCELNKNNYPELDYYYAVPNGAKLGYKKLANGKHVSPQAIKLKKEGLKAGVPDTCLPVPKGRYHGLYIELKTPTGKPSEDQIRYVNFIKDQGYFACFCVGWENASIVLEWYLSLPPFNIDAINPIPKQAVDETYFAPKRGRSKQLGK